MKNAKRFISIVLCALMLMTAFTAAAASAAGGTLAGKYATNPGGKVGKQGSITIDGDFSDWSDDMLIATSAAWDVANHYKGAHENCLIDAYALFACWDSSNLYIGMQYVNTTDTWQNAGDASLSDGGKMGDLHLVLALSVDPSSPGMNGKVTDGKYIWGDQITYQTHVDHLFYMSTKAGLGTPGHFTAADSTGVSDYTTHCANFKTQGIDYKMVDGNVCSSIWGLNDSQSPDDVCDENADWVDYKTYKGSKGVHNTKYDTFYEMKIPFAALGITASDLTSRGIGAMTLCGRGESALDCCPFDLSMIDNVKGDYAADPSTSHEKDDLDTITAPLARIGKSDGSVPVVTPTNPPATDPVVTNPPETQPVVTDPPVDYDKLSLTASSNIFPTQTYEGKKGDTVSVKYELNSGMKVCNGQWALTYDSSMLRLKSSAKEIMPNAEGVVNIDGSTVYGNFTEVNDPYSFTPATFVQAEFEVIENGNAKINLDVQELSVCNVSGGSINYRNVVRNSQKQNITSEAGFSGATLSGETALKEGGLDAPVVTGLKVNATSNFFPAGSAQITENDKQVTVKYRLSSNIGVLNSDWTLTYDPSKLSLSSSNRKNMFPVSGAVVKEKTTGTVKGNFTNISYEDFKNERDFVSVTFDVVGKGTTTVDLQMFTLGIGFEDGNSAKESYIVDRGSIVDPTSTSGFSNAKYGKNTVVAPGGANVMWGDVNLDGVVTIDDATCIQKHLASFAGFELTGTAKLAADTDGDGNITIADATKIQKYLAKID